MANKKSDTKRKCNFCYVNLSFADSNGKAVKFKSTYDDTYSTVYFAKQCKNILEANKILDSWTREGGLDTVLYDFAKTYTLRTYFHKCNDEFPAGVCIASIVHVTSEKEDDTYKQLKSGNYYKMIEYKVLCNVVDLFLHQNFDSLVNIYKKRYEKAGYTASDKIIDEKNKENSSCECSNDEKTVTLLDEPEKLHNDVSNQSKCSKYLDKKTSSIEYILDHDPTKGKNVVKIRYRWWDEHGIRHEEWYKTECLNVNTALDYIKKEHERLYGI